MCEYIEGGIETDVQPDTSWSREFFDEVAQARLAMERADKLVDWRRQKAYSLPSHIDTDVPELVDAEADKATVYNWARDVLNDFDDLAAAQRQSLRGELLEGLDIAEAKYRLGEKVKAITSAFCISNDTLYRRLGALTDYLDYLGPERAFDISQDERADAPIGFAAPEPVDTWEDSGLMPGLDDLGGEGDD